MADGLSAFDVVTVPAGLPEYGVPAGATATVIDVYETPPGVEIEVVDDQGRTIFSGAVDFSRVEAGAVPGDVQRASPGARSRTMDDLADDHLRGRLLGLLVSVSSRLAADDGDEIGGLIDHSEFGLALETLAWSIVEDELVIDLQDLEQIQRIAADMNMAAELPAALRAHTIE